MHRARTGRLDPGAGALAQLLVFAAGGGDRGIEATFRARKSVSNLLQHSGLKPFALADCQGVLTGRTSTGTAPGRQRQVNRCIC